MYLKSVLDFTGEYNKLSELLQRITKSFNFDSQYKFLFQTSGTYCQSNKIFSNWLITNKYTFEEPIKVDPVMPYYFDCMTGNFHEIIIIMA